MGTFLKWSGWTGIVTAIFGLGFAIIGPIIDRMFPIWTNVMLDGHTTNPDGSIDFRLMGTRVRANCQTLELQWYEVLEVGTLLPAGISATEDVPTFHPLGEQRGVLWHARRPGRYVLFATYACGLPWNTQAILGPVDVQ